VLPIFRLCNIPHLNGSASVDRRPQVKSVRVMKAAFHVLFLILLRGLSSSVLANGACVTASGPSGGRCTRSAGLSPFDKSRRRSRRLSRSGMRLCASRLRPKLNVRAFALSAGLILFPVRPARPYTRTSQSAKTHLRENLTRDRERSEGFLKGETMA
jgi:hypothetical protein